MINIHIIPVLKDNYTYLIHEPIQKKTAVIDPSDIKPVLNILKKKNWSLDYIWNTHHHWDHTDGNLPLKEKTWYLKFNFETEYKDFSNLSNLTSEFI